MPASLDEVLRPVWPYPGDPLLSPACIAQIAAVARRLPAGMSEFAGFECRLRAAETRRSAPACSRSA